MGRSTAGCSTGTQPFTRTLETNAVSKYATLGSRRSTRTRESAICRPSPQTNWKVVRKGRNCIINGPLTRPHAADPPESEHRCLTRHPAVSASETGATGYGVGKALQGRVSEEEWDDGEKEEVGEVERTMWPPFISVVTMSALPRGSRVPFRP